MRTDKTDGLVVFYLYGWIENYGYYNEVFAQQIAEAKASQSEIVFYINSPGGDVLGGANLFDEIKAYPYKTTAIVRGMAASMAAFLLFAFDQVEIGSKSRIMFHQVGGTSNGYMTADQMRELANTIETLTEDYVKESNLKIKVSSEQLETMGLAENTAASEYFRAKIAKGDWWLTPAEAKAIKLVDVIINDPEQDSLPNDAPTATAASATAYYNKVYKPLNAVALSQHQPSSPPPTFKAMSKEALKELGLPEDATEAQILNAIKGLTKKSAEADAIQEEAAEAAIQAAVKSGKILAASVPYFQAKAKQDPKGIIQDMQHLVSANPLANMKRTTDVLNTQASASSDGINNFEDITAMGSDFYEKFKAEEPQKFKALYKKHFGFSPSE